MSEITINTDEVIAAIVAKIDTSMIQAAIQEHVSVEVRRVVAKDARESIKDAVRAAVADAMPTLTESITAHVADEMKVRERRFASRLARAAGEDENAGN